MKLTEGVFRLNTEFSPGVNTVSCLQHVHLDKAEDQKINRTTLHWQG